MKLMHVTFNRCFDRLLGSWIINDFFQESAKLRFKEGHSFFDFASYFLKPLKLSNIHYLHNPIIHLFYRPKILHNHCLQVLLGHEDVLRENKNNAYANFWGVKEVYYGICASSEFQDQQLFNISSLPWKERKSFEINNLFVTLSNNLRTLIQLSKWDRCDKVTQLYHKTRQIKWRATRKVKFAAGFRRTEIGICIGLISQKGSKTPKNSGIQCCKFLFHQETVVLRRWKGETWKFGFIKRVDKAFPNLSTVVEYISMWETGVETNTQKLGWGEYSVKNEKKHYRESHVLLRNHQEISAYFTVLCSCFSVWAMNKYCTVAVCRNGSKKRPDLNYCCFTWGPMIVRSAKFYVSEQTKNWRD